MKAISYIKYGSPDVLDLVEIDRPTPSDNQVLIKVHAAAANPADWHLMRGSPFIARLSAGITKPKNNLLGADVSGQVEAIGKNVTEFKVGDDVFGCLPLSELGSFADFVCGSAEVLAHKPSNLTHEQAAAVPLAALTALQGLRDKGQLSANQKVLINGASGGVGTFAVQLAKAFGAEVTGVCSTKNLSLVSSIGADHVVDYTKSDFTTDGIQYDLVFDAVGNRSVGDLKRALKDTGIASVAGFTSLKRLFQTMVIGGKKVGLMATMKPSKQDILLLRELLETGKVVPVIDKTYSLEQTTEAIRYLETGHAKGKVVIKLV